MRLICMKRRVIDLFTDFVFPAMEAEKKLRSVSDLLVVGASWAWDSFKHSESCVLWFYLEKSWLCCHASSSTYLLLLSFPIYIFGYHKRLNCYFSLLLKISVV